MRTSRIAKAKNPWVVGCKGGDDILKQFTVSRPVSGGSCAREWIMDGDFVKIFKTRVKAEDASNAKGKQ